jgi:hypothetical protein
MSARDQAPPRAVDTRAEELVALNRQRRSDLEAQFATRPVRTPWASSAWEELETRLQAVVAGLGGAQLESHECRDRMCHARLILTEDQHVSTVTNRIISSSFRGCALAVITDPAAAGARWLTEVYWTCAPDAP